MHSIPFEPKLKATSSLLIEDPKIEILLDNIDSRKHVPIVHKKNGNVVYVPRYTNRDAAISGKIQTNFTESMAHKYNAKIELIGKIDFYGIKGKSFKFVTIEKDLGRITDTNGSIEFKFENIPNKYESYSGLLAEITYMLRATVINYDLEETKHEQEIVLHLPTRSPPNANVFIIQIGVMEAVEVDLEYKKTDYHLEECIVGRILVNVAKVEIKKIEVYLMKVENYFFGSKSKLQEEVLKKIIVKEGQPKKGEMIPLKLSLGPLDLSPTMQNVEDRYSIRYFLTLGLIDSNERMFFRKVEITLRRAMEFEK